MNPADQRNDHEHLLRLTSQVMDNESFLSSMSPGELATLCRQLAGFATELAANRPGASKSECSENAEKMEALGMFAGGIAHDFNNILGIIANRATLVLVEQYSDPGQCEHMKQILRATDRGKELIKQILSFSRPGDRTLAPLALGPILEDSVSFLSGTLPAGIAIHLESAPTPVLVQGDATQLSQIVMNLAANAAVAMPNGGRLTLRLSADEEKGLALLEVEDTGVGIRPELLPRIFEPYFTTSSGGRGTGLGLAVVHGVVKLHAGTIHCDSCLGGGTCFSISLPLVSKDVAAAQPVQTEPASLQWLPPSEPGRARRILFVDDEVELARTSRKLLESFGHQPMVFTDPAQALAAFSQAPFGFDIVITDMLMPDMDGQELAQEILSHNPDVPIILCTGYSETFSREQSLTSGIRGSVPKPIDWLELDALIGELTAHSGVASRP